MNPALEAVGPEVFIGLVGAVGTDLELVCAELDAALGDVSYKTYTFRLSELLHKPGIPGVGQLLDSPEDRRIDTHMTGGNNLRKYCARGDALAMLAVLALREYRRCKAGSEETPLPRQAYVFKSLKHPDEVATLRHVYGSAFVLISAYCPREARRLYLAQRIARSHHAASGEQYLDLAETLIKRDQFETNVEYGQNVSSTFPLADVFVDASHPVKLRHSLTRFVEALLGHPFHTPSQDEYGMFHARAAALRSADLSRQVGAAIATPEGEIIAVGCNDVPKGGGGFYWEGDESDARDFQLGRDTSSEMKAQMVTEIAERLQKEGWFSDDLGKLSAEELCRRALVALSDVQVMNVGEFGRSVHAEMAAIVSAARRGAPIQGATLYTTTFPCHNCAKHIVASGISRVMYVEPYPKSLAGELFSDSICIEGGQTKAGSRVRFEPFVGVAPRQYMGLFEMTVRKGEDGKPVRWDAKTAAPRTTAPAAAYLTSETECCNDFTQKVPLLAEAGREEGDEEDLPGE